MKEKYTILHFLDINYKFKGLMVLAVTLFLMEGKSYL